MKRYDSSREDLLEDYSYEIAALDYQRLELRVIIRMLNAVCVALNRRRRKNRERKWTRRQKVVQTGVYFGDLSCGIPDKVFLSMMAAVAIVREYGGDVDINNTEHQLHDGRPGVQAHATISKLGKMNLTRVIRRLLAVRKELRELANRT